MIVSTNELDPLLTEIAALISMVVEKFMDSKYICFAPLLQHIVCEIIV